MLTVNCIIVGCSRQQKQKREFSHPAEFLLPGQVRVTELNPKLFYFFNIYNNAQETVKPGPCNLSAAVLNCAVERLFHTNKKAVRDHTRLSTRHTIYTFCKRVIAGRYSSAINACPVNHVQQTRKTFGSTCAPLLTPFFFLSFPSFSPASASASITFRHSKNHCESRGGKQCLK